MHSASTESMQSPVNAALYDGEPEEDQGKAKSTVLHTDPVASVETTAINIISNVVGAGILSIPAAVASMSVIPGLIVLTLFAVMSSYSMLLLTLCAQRTNRFTYKDLIEYAFNSSRAGRAFDGAIFVYTFACTIAYAKAVGDSMSPVMRYLTGKDGTVEGHGFWILMAAFIFFPLSSMKQLAELKISSLFGFLVIVYLIGVVIVNFFQNNSPTGARVNAGTPWGEFGLGFIQNVPICSVAYSCHYNVPVFYGEMKKRSPTKMMKAVGFAFPVITVMYFAAAIFSVLHFNADDIKKKGDISLNFPDSYMPMTVGRIGLFIHFVCVYPIVCIASRRALNSVLFNRGNMSRLVYIGEAFVLVATTCLIAWRAQSVTEVFQFNGALFGISIVVVIPNLLYLKIYGGSAEAERADDVPRPYADTALLQDGDDSAAKGWASLEALAHRTDGKMLVAAKCLIVFGLCLSVAAFALDIYKLVHGDDNGSSNNAAPASNNGSHVHPWNNTAFLVAAFSGRASPLH